MSGGQIVVFPATTQQNQIAWQGIPGSSDTVLFLNSDLNNYAYLGYTPNAQPNINTIPVAPNGSFVLPANRTIYAIWELSTGVSPLVIIPGGIATFLGLTQGLGNLAIPSVQSPNFVSGVSGWQIAKDGSAQFNNLTIRGTFFGLDFIINNNGAFFYNGTPALGNLKISIVSNGGGIDSFGNVYKDNITTYNVAVAGGGYVQMAANPTTGIPFVVLQPPGLTSNSGPPQVNAGAVNAGLVNEISQLNLNSGFGTGPGAAGAAVLQLVSEANDASSNSIANIIAGQSQATKKDANVYPIGQLDKLGTALPQTINQTTAQTVTGCTANLVAGTYRVEVESIFTGSAAGAGNPSYQIGTTVTTSLFWGTGIFWQTSGAGAGANRWDTSITGMNFQGPAMVAAAVYIVKMKGYITATSSGAISLQAFTSAAADSYVINEAALTLTPLF